MGSVFVIGEDSLCCALGEKLVMGVLGWSLAQPAVDTKGVTHLQKNLARYTGIARLHPVLCLADSDGECVLHMRQHWLPHGAPNGFHLRLAVPEIDSWMMADREALADFFRVPESRIPNKPDELQDAKQAVLNLARQSKQRCIRGEVVTRNNTQGVGYNVHMREFVSNHWRPHVAKASSPSLARAIRRLDELKAATP